ncbi:MAG: ASKHA domain-containing protein [Eubacterium sp.]|nr:ASKHA domain-containing protein [Eubacterium sp.]
MKSYDLLIDLGTTTIAMVLYDFDNKKCAHTDLSLNPQAAYGADVITRMESSLAGKSDELSSLIRNHLATKIKQILDKSGVQSTTIRRISIGGNTTMIYLMMGYSCECLSKSPFIPDRDTPESLIYNADSNCFYPADEKCSSDNPFCIETVFVPWSSAFIGGDIVAGLSSLPDFCPADETKLFLDLGTNGEMVLSHNGNLYATATAAGPAFEGAGLTCGIGAVPGAISDVRLKSLRPALTTIDNALPVGICGSGAISLVSELADKGLVNRDSSLNPDFPENGIELVSHIVFTADDFQKVLLAKAAIAAGIDTLVKASGAKTDDIKKLYLAGSFGNNINLKACETIKLFSDIPVSVVECIGNSCLSGLMRVSAEEIIIPEIHDINLGKSDYFKKKYLEHIAL